MNATPSGMSPARATAWSGPIVDMSITVAPEASAATTPSGPSRTSRTTSGVASIVITASAPAAASAGESATRAAPSIASARARVRFHTVTAWPASIRRVAIGAPIAPSPRNASLATASLSARP